MKLYELNGHIEYVNSLIEYQDGEVTPEVQAALDELETNFKMDSADDAVAWLRNLEAESKALEEEADAFTKRRRVADKRIEWIKGMLVRCMDAFGVQKHKGRFVISVRDASRPSIRWAGKGEIPKKYRRVEVTLDGNLAYEDWKLGKLPEGFQVEFSRFVTVK